MRILFVSPRQCWPIASGANLREYHFLRGLAEPSELTYAFFREPAFEAPTAEDLPFCNAIEPVLRPPVYNAGRLVRGLLGRYPLPVVNYTSAEMTATIARLASATPFDAVHFDSTHMAAYVPVVRKLLPRARIFFDWHNIESEGMRRFAEVTPSTAKAMYARLTARKMESLERDLVRKPFGHFVCSERERERLAEIAPGSRVEVIENGVDTSSFPRPSAAGQRILFVGLMAYHANIDAVTWFVREIWPAVRGRFPDKVLTIVGAKPAAEVLALAAEPGVEVTGTVPDVKPYYNGAFAAIAPLRTGAGTRLKILEAMAARIPVISTAIGAEGLGIRPGSDILLAETPDEWVEAFARLHDQTFRDALTTAAHQLASDRYDWSIIRAVLYRTFSRWMQDGTR
jgi:glycosyltransferase involved in cell wall biosynthesis